jgi:hypothetical protein
MPVNMSCYNPQILVAPFTIFSFNKEYKFIGTLLVMGLGEKQRAK